MTRILLNDEEISLDRGGATVEALLKQLSINDLERIAVAVNDNVLRRSDWASYQLEENDRVLMIAPIQGG
ncbi:MAG: sulfur carrier protein ThiS [Gammaproteobacteria bacterium]|nr:sulfur carrier protein ThiS [Gammaproteobacteria bacterium]MCB1860526.1 sulfur carrier protein ThiS [Gammaproteobacteria bacterium]MCB1881592.1 sulfur carrier protein ThiS [Gammaproteobacteria bacterium]MCB1905656.1 sulfur carrier protein ThiS [Gammaproteobacteria bacterium]